MNDVTLRSATTEDTPFMQEVYASTREDELAMVPWSAEEKDAFLLQQSQAQLHHYAEHYPEAQYRIIVFDGTDIGRLLLDESGTDVRLMDIALLPEYRGRGIGTTLVEDVIERARELDLPVILHVEAENPAMRLYRRLGFVVDGDAGVYQRMILSRVAVAS